VAFSISLGECQSGYYLKIVHGDHLSNPYLLTIHSHLPTSFSSI